MIEMNIKEDICKFGNNDLMKTVKMKWKEAVFKHLTTVFDREGKLAQDGPHRVHTHGNPAIHERRLLTAPQSPHTDCKRYTI